MSGMAWLSLSSQKYLDAAKITVDTAKCLRTAFVDAVDRGLTTGATLQAEHAAFYY